MSNPPIATIMSNINMSEETFRDLLKKEMPNATITDEEITKFYNKITKLDNYYEVYVENGEIDLEEYSGPYVTYEECVEYIEEKYTKKTINDEKYTFEIQYQKSNGEGEYYSYP